MNGRGWLIAQLARPLAPLVASPAVLRWAIAQTREHGPARPPRYLRQQIQFDEEMWQGLRIFQAVPRGDSSSRVQFLYLHGGAHVLDLLSLQWFLVAGLLKRVGGVVTIPIYPLGPENNWRVTVAAVRGAYEHLVARQDAADVIVVGDSSGGGLALLLAQALRDARRPMPAALVLFSPWLDLAMSGEDQPALERRDPLLTMHTARRAARLWAPDVALDDPRVSPLFGDQSGLPPTIVFSGDRDLLHSDAIRLAARNRQVVLRAYRDMLHVWPVGPLRESRQAFDEAADFVKQHAPEAREAGN